MCIFGKFRYRARLVNNLLEKFEKKEKRTRKRKKRDLAFFFG